MPINEPPPHRAVEVTHVTVAARAENDLLYYSLHPNVMRQLQRIEDKLNSIMKELGFKQP